MELRERNPAGAQFGRTRRDHLYNKQKATCNLERIVDSAMSKMKADKIANHGSTGGLGERAEQIGSHTSDIWRQSEMKLIIQRMK